MEQNKLSMNLGEIFDTFHKFVQKSFGFSKKTNLNLKSLLLRFRVTAKLTMTQCDPVWTERVGGRRGPQLRI